MNDIEACDSDMCPCFLQNKEKEEATRNNDSNNNNNNNNKKKKNMVKSGHYLHQWGFMI